MSRRKYDSGEIATIAILIIIFIVFTIMSGGKLVSAYNINSIVDQAIIFIIAGFGTIFVVAQGGADLSIGATLGITTVVSTMVATTVGVEWIIFPVAIGLAVVLGLIVGVFVTKLKVPSFMTTLAFLIGLRGLMLYLQQEHTTSFYLIDMSGMIAMFKLPYVKYSILVVLVILFHFIMKYTKFGTYSKAIGENEAVAINVGIPIAKMKIIAFVLSAVMAAIAGFFTLARYGGTNNAMGANLEINVLIGIFVGGVLVSGGYGSKISKLIVGCLTVSIIQVGMAVSGYGETTYVQIVEGVVLILILFFVLKLKKLDMKRSDKFRESQTEEDLQKV